MIATVPFDVALSVVSDTTLILNLKALRKAFL